MNQLSKHQIKNKIKAFIRLIAIIFIIFGVFIACVYTIISLIENFEFTLQLSQLSRENTLI
jgi:hypothetical protein